MSIFFRCLHNKIHSCWFLGTDFSGPPEYTVTSPRPSVVAGNVAGEMKHRVQAAADYKAAESQDADHTVLLKLKEGDEYKLVLNMQVCNLILRWHNLVLFLSSICSNTEALYCQLSINFRATLPKISRSN